MVVIPLLLALSASAAGQINTGEISGVVRDSNPNFGRIFSAKSPREMQFGLRFAF